MLAAAARALARLEIDSLKKDVGPQEVDWGPVEVWRTFGLDLINGNDEECKSLRERICRLLLEKHAACAKHFLNPLSISPDGDIDQTNFDSALQTAKSLGLLRQDETADASDRLKQWAVAMLSPTCQCSEDVLKAVLDWDLKGQVGILCLSRHKKAHAGHAYNYTITAHQPLVLKGAVFLIAIYQKSEQEHVDTSTQKVGKTRSKKHRPGDGTVAAADVG
jgi:hypothetical protein